ncbi:hypothetical protein [Erythrobacter sp.]|uniref:hypothetical protein n=1 Tax=Erythrobacter sp. TaxID=1042 RepID=UPI0025E0B774|nr:hypothetical protein [Erythrobacter sp.]
MSFSNRFVAVLGVGGLALLAAAPLSAQVMPDPDATEVAKTPLRDLNLDGRDIPEPLQIAALDPYAMAGMETCNALVADIAELDRVLGADYDIADEDGNDRLSEGRIAQGVIGSFLPFRGIVREVTGAASNDRLLRAAYTAGMVRRAFLKGVGMGRGCKYPARPKPVVEAGN